MAMVLAHFHHGMYRVVNPSGDSNCTGTKQSMQSKLKYCQHLCHDVSRPSRFARALGYSIFTHFSQISWMSKNAYLLKALETDYYGIVYLDKDAASPQQPQVVTLALARRATAQESGLPTRWRIWPCYMEDSRTPA